MLRGVSIPIAAPYSGWVCWLPPPAFAADLRFRAPWVELWPAAGDPQFFVARLRAPATMRKPRDCMASAALELRLQRASLPFMTLLYQLLWRAKGSLHTIPNRCASMGAWL